MNKINKIITTECMIILYTKQSIMRIPMIDCLKHNTHWRVIERRGFLIAGGSIDPKITDNELECLALLHPVQQPQSMSDMSCSNSNAVCRK